MNDWENNLDIFTCPYCKTEDMVLPVGNNKSPLLIIGEFPGEDEIKKGRPLVGAVGAIIKKELFYLGVDMSQMRITNLWLHAPNKNEKCFQHGVEKAIEEAKNRKAILLLGSTSTKYFTSMNVSDVAGLQVTSPYLSAPIIIASPHPNFNSGIGEFRLALKKFVKVIKNDNLLR